MVQWLYLRGGGGDWYIPTKINNNNNKKNPKNKQITNQKETNNKQKTQTTHSLKAEVREYSL